ncbi:hypothetical protein [Pedobacter frigiditerrae]|uniref:hypothetical protein n=1 Tax=Pedobacter frigiditerrae TaxID=2530452 RepID=UPI0029300AC2|nr:hypothetical protein [Pedobacter frigiditerrae]
MRSLYLSKYLPLFLLPLNMLAQVKVIDSATKQPIKGVTVSLDNITAVQITDEFGVIDLSKLNLSEDKSIILTSVGYQKKIINAKNVQQIENINLVPVTYSLKEVSINTRRYRKHLVGGGMSLLHGTNSYGGYSFEDARYFPNEYNEHSKIVAVHYFIVKNESFQKKTKVDLSNAFGVGVYEANADGSPGKPLLTEALVVMAKEHAEWFEVNLEQYNLPMPKYGFVVSFKVFSASFYGVKDKFTNYKDIVAPILAIKTYLKKSNDSWHKGLYPNSKWKREERSHFGIRAMVAEGK